MDSNVEFDLDDLDDESRREFEAKLYSKLYIGQDYEDMQCSVERADVSSNPSNNAETTTNHQEDIKDTLTLLNSEESESDVSDAVSNASSEDMGFMVLEKPVQVLSGRALPPDISVKEKINLFNNLKRKIEEHKSNETNDIEIDPSSRKSTKLEIRNELISVTHEVSPKKNGSISSKVNPKEHFVTFKEAYSTDESGSDEKSEDFEDKRNVLPKSKVSAHIISPFLSSVEHFSTLTPRHKPIPNVRCVSWTDAMHHFYDEQPVAFAHDHISDVLENLDGDEDGSEEKKGSWSVDSLDLRPSKSRSRYFSMRCRNCNETGHAARTCRRPPKRVVCHMCGLEGHKSDNCVDALCLKCGRKRVNYSIGCGICDRLDRVKCTLCGVLGHVQNKCPDHWRRHCFLGQENVVHREKNQLWCTNCASQGHSVHECPHYMPHNYSVFVQKVIGDSNHSAIAPSSATATSAITSSETPLTSRGAWRQRRREQHKVSKAMMSKASKEKLAKKERSVTRERAGFKRSVGSKQRMNMRDVQKKGFPDNHAFKRSKKNKFRNASKPLFKKIWF